ncbi:MULTISPECIES: bifunctional glycosyltransferase family 2 protein/CDP-glycerol:glycerophosphate glycerophosphotransferase [Mammaliicoccus]|uniref:Bifunctional glycosyltransferase family 2 protein/CDP-glycerol:glycerophosphate glycerophosphotransferase n=1 Tax=Mammaliicoccus sciuri TaxID=1296 RepID=A0ABT7HV27_MAMSC|nr:MULTISPECIES: bifunctional glycosyltransferase family 2 protein/CDP-glycerol:glycerophosphate glycerophosphotransferase [Mammaliicoccus]MDL0111098.1 bifunctional glycosyltransferase family 2 protein/CDP-glycerol:glycerophosphate glycerophosphotransferase [Mammaliicoccus sciuri]MDL0115842.1 bifunctional glycosyltransferase family 2 protein/CDP-glycerol:glycerophosphate glycerophosphotransferase [Mammaliicoccus sciuri]WQJ64872.1 bifunctional glycosyltransferase family 2 protein/CDP-glycerol:gly
MNELTIIITYYNKEDYILDCIGSIKNQRNQNFDLIIVNDGSTDSSNRLVNEAINNYDKNVNHINLDRNYGHAYARNIALENVETKYFMFLDADDQLASYSVEYYLSKINGLDGLIGPINKFSLKKPQYVNKDKIRIDYLTKDNNPNSFLRKNTVCNILFKTSIVKAHNIRFNEDLKIYIDTSFALEYIKYVERFVRLRNFPFYFRGEIYDPFEGNTLSDQDFIFTFEDYVNSYLDSIKRTNNKEILNFLSQKMKLEIKKGFDPSLRDINIRYSVLEKPLINIVKTLKWNIIKDGKILYKLELLFLSMDDIENAKYINNIRSVSRHVKNIVQNNKMKNRSKYQLLDKEEAVNNETIVFESFGGKNYSDSPKYIYEYMQKHYPKLNYIWVFKNPNQNVITGNAVKVKKGSKEYYDAYSKAKFWVTNARLPLYLNKKDNQIYIQTWHGTPLKRLANDMKIVRMPGTTTPKYKKNFYAETSRWDYLISPNRYSTNIFKTAFWMDENRTLEIGYPRNDILVNRSNDQKYIEKLKKELNIPKGKKIIMYAPTWRDDEFVKKGKYLFDLKINLENLQKELGDEFVILLRMHYLISNALDLSGYEDFAIDVSNYNDISELYLISDALITDYSSVMFDFGILKRPQYFFAYDIEKYDKGLRGFYMDYMNDLPGEIITDEFKLAEELKDIDKHKEKYKDKIERFYDKFCSIEKGQSSKIIGDFIYDKTK